MVDANLNARLTWDLKCTGCFKWFRVSSTIGPNHSIFKDAAILRYIAIHNNLSPNNRLKTPISNEILDSIGPEPAEHSLPTPPVSPEKQTRLINTPGPALGMSSALAVIHITLNVVVYVKVSLSPLEQQ